ncbi:MAG: YbhB/YbcL family Raf kinase inhibitor-like protein [Anaeromyxobacter sp.]
MPMTLTSPAFADGGEIPTTFTCEGADRSPALVFAGVPPEARSLALLVDDPDAPDPKAPQRIYTHWVLYDMPPDAGGLPEAVKPAALPPGTRQGTNDWRRTGWGGPCPPIGRHRYYFTLFALDAPLGDRGPLGRKELLAAVEGHVVAQAQLLGTYQKHMQR